MEKPKQTLLVCGAQINIELASRFFPEWYVCRVGESLIGYRFERIVLLLGNARDSEEECAATSQWLQNDLACRLTKDGIFEILG